MSDRWILQVSTVLLTLASLGAPVPGRSLGQIVDPEVQARTERIRKDVFTLASPEFEGRRGIGGQKAAAFVENRFRELRLSPFFEGSFTQTIPGQKGIGEMGRNVGAMLPGIDPKLRDEWVIVAAHFDHLGVREGRLYPGADDNASSVAMMLELARFFSTSPEKPRRGLIFLGFDLEEAGLFGSRYFVEHSPVPLEKVRLFITADMIGRSLGGVCGEFVFVMGSENSPEIRPWIETGAQGLPLRIGRIGADLLMISRSDYGPFRSRKVPYLFFSTGENPHYHQPSDVPETLDYAKAEAITRLIQSVTNSALRSEVSPRWTSNATPDLQEALAFRDVFKRLLSHPDELKLGSAQTLLMKNTLKTLDAIADRGVMTAEERIAILRIARIILVSVF